MRNLKMTTLVCFILLSSCARFVTWDDFTLIKTPYNGNELRLDGYYCQVENGMYNSAYCFYRDGCLLNMGGYRTSLEEMDVYIKQTFFENSHASRKQSWGIFTIKNEIIRFERYYISDDIRKHSYIREGSILNDSTFHIIVSYRSDGSERGETDEVYHFRKFNFKPDSINDFIK